ncbi:uncharacterized protein HD556DRAFT_587665 [Suillus plorans]|uniref:C2H2-type domain-containing protein n=1 Tax=Suillus plorans TaxID=116603 RepID=A0A9P7DGM7_9AGAM|nr:uncharacterized protein HD556DRAFT_587665 [Suillus plorans]KAG1792071.1 hypothetical protein HD556DRAFT_587665 [Suillus plorans]
MDIKLGSISQLSQVFSSHSQSPIVHKRERSMDSSTPTLQSPSSSQSWQVPNQQPTELVLQSCLQYLDRLDSLERHMHEEIQEIRSHFRNTIDSYESNATMADSDGCDSVVDSPQAGLDGRNAIARRGLPLRGTSDSVHEPAAQLLQDINFEERVPSSSSVRPDTQLPVPVVQASQAKGKVKCTRDGCSTHLNKDNLTRHINEVHEGKIRAVCPSCGQGFKRPILMREHVLRTGPFRGAELYDHHTQAAEFATYT